MTIYSFVNSLHGACLPLLLQKSGRPGPRHPLYPLLPSQSTTDHQSWAVYSSGGPKSEIKGSVGCVSSETCRGEEPPRLSLSFWWLPAILSVLKIPRSPPCLSGHMALSRHLCLHMATLLLIRRLVILIKRHPTFI